MSRAARPPDQQWVVLQETATPPESPLMSHSGRRSTTAGLSPAELDAQASQLLMAALERSNASSAVYKPQASRPLTQGTTPLRAFTPPPSAFGKITFSSVMGLARGRSLSKSRKADKERGSSVASAPGSADDAQQRRGRTRSVSPFFARARTGRSPSVGPLRQDDVSDYESSASRRADDDDDATVTGPADSDEEDWSDGPEAFDEETIENTTKNAHTPDVKERADYSFGLEPDPDPLGEGVNVVVPAKTEPYFSGQQHGRRGRKQSKLVETLPLQTGRPHFQRDRCAIRLVQGEFTSSGRRYVVATDRSEESRYALEWAIGTVLRDGDELFIVTVVETDSKLDPASGVQQADRVLKLRNQQERQTLAFLLAKQATQLLQRTKLNVAVTCQAWHAKNNRHLLLDIVDYLEPIMLIVGSRGVGQLKGILLGSTAHYLIQKSSVPVMVARRRLKRPAKRTAHLAPSRAPRVPLSKAAIDKAGPGRDKDVVDMRHALELEEAEEIARRDSGADPDVDAEDEATEDDVEGDGSGEDARSGKVAGD
ncbi:hypothetical protein AURDEDRAFT_115542 [Auricularia subglabra TFB-10046 SS5]|nr:hypothetical protein AURDEDRAFT_115542 [Auricularia subglabra TFB-10046 SS5]